MKAFYAVLLTLCFFVSVAMAAEKDGVRSNSTSVPDHAWSLDSASSEQLRQKGSSVAEAVGVRNQSLILKGKSLLEVKNSEATPDSQKPFSFVAWFNPYNLDRGQQMIAAKNRYSLNER